MKSSNISPVNILIFLLAFLALGAVYGGTSLVVSPSGELLGTPLSMLDASPFDSFLIPGIILFFALGIFPVIVIIALIKKPYIKIAEQLNFFKDMYWAWSFTIYVAFILIIWIQLQVLFINDLHWSHAFYVFLAIGIIFIALLPQVRNSYKK